MKTAAAILSLCCLSTALPVAENAALIPRSHPESAFSTHLFRRTTPCVNHTCALLETAFNTSSPKFLAGMSLGKQSFLVEIDTGSANLWVAAKGFKCYPMGKSVLNVTASTKTEPESRCNFGRLWSPDSSFKVIPDVLSYQSYGATGEETRDLSGPLGFHDLTFAGFNVPKALVGAINMSSFPAQGSHQQSGLLGMGFTDLAVAYNLTAGQEENIPSTMDILFNEHPKLPKMFSMVISRDASNTGYGGLLTIGGVPSLTSAAVNVSSTTPASASFLRTNINRTKFQPDGKLTFYIINVTFSIGGAPYDGDTPVLIDSGTPYASLPIDTANAINSAWSPPAVYSKEDQGYLVECNATNTAEFGVIVGSTTFFVSEQDMISPYNKTMCFSQVVSANSTSPGTYVLGDVFMKNVVSVFDWSSSMASFYPRQFYKS